MLPPAQHDYWNGPNGERWATHQQRLDEAFAAIGQFALAEFAARSGERLLDVGCGAGTTTIALADAVGVDGKVVGLDVSEALVAVAKRRTQVRPEIEIRLADAASSTFDRRFDGIFSRFGTMFFEQPEVAFTHLRTQLSPGGRLGFVCWRSIADNPWVHEVLRTVATVLNCPLPSPPPRQPGPFAFADASYVEELLSGAGFASIDVQEVHLPVCFSHRGVDDAVEFGLRVGVGAAAKLVAGCSVDVLSEVEARLRSRLTEFASGNLVTLPSTTWLVSARSPNN